MAALFLTAIISVVRSYDGFGSEPTTDIIMLRGRAPYSYFDAERGAVKKKCFDAINFVQLITVIANQSAE